MTLTNIILSIFGLLISTLIGIAIGFLNGMKKDLHGMTEKVYGHDSEFARTDERIRNLLQIAQAAHARMDRMEQVRG